MQYTFEVSVCLLSSKEVLGFVSNSSCNVSEGMLALACGLWNTQCPKNFRKLESNVLEKAISTGYGPIQSHTLRERRAV